MTGATRRTATTGGVVVATTLLATAVLFGGGGSPAPLAEAGVELAALLALVAAAALDAQPLHLVRTDPPLALLLGAILLLPIAQLVSLPPSWVGALPGRAGEAAALAATGEGSAWRPWSMLPDATLAGALSLIAPAALLLLTAATPGRHRVRLVALLAILGFGAALVGLVQFIRGPDAPLSLYDDIHRGWAIGFFANRNARPSSGENGPSVAVALVAPASAVTAVATRVWVTGSGAVAETSTA